MKQYALHTYSSALETWDCPAGGFQIDLISKTAKWSDGMYRLHGYERGEVVPSIELIMSHKHPEDRQQVREIIGEVCRDGGHFSIYHRIIDAHGRLHRVVTSGEGLKDEAGKVIGIEGTMVDLTATLQRETEQAAREAVAGATATRSAIDQARGLLMGRLQIGSDLAFELLIAYSSRKNRKLAVVSAYLMELAAKPDTVESRERLDAAIRDILDAKPRRTRRDARD